MSLVSRRILAAAILEQFPLSTRVGGEHERAWHSASPRRPGEKLSNSSVSAKAHKRRLNLQSTSAGTYIDCDQPALHRQCLINDTSEPLSFQTRTEFREQ